MICRRFYSGASVFVFPSLYEGVRTSASRKRWRAARRSSVSRVASLPEVCADAAVYVDPKNIGHIADAMGALLEKPQERERLRAAGLVNVRRFNWNRWAEETWSLYEAVAAKRR